MSRKFVAGLIMNVAMVAGTQTAWAGDNLFKNYAYESPQSQYTEANGYYDCSDSVGGNAMCIDDVDFIGHKFTAALIFSGSKLIMVSLLSSYDQELYASSMGAIGQTFSLSSLSDGKSSFDVVELAATAASSEEFESKLTGYEVVALNSGSITYTFLEGVDKHKKYKNITSLMSAMPDNVRVAELVVAGKGPETAVVIRFSFPKLEANKVAAAVKKPVESF